GMATETTAESFQLVSKSPVIVDFAVEDHCESATRGLHGLVPQWRQLHNRQPPEAQRNPGRRVDPNAAVVWATVRDRRAHAFGDFMQTRGAPLPPGKDDRQFANGITYGRPT